MKISGLAKVTLTDFPGVVSCIIFTQGCNFKCPFCHNKDLIKVADGTVEEQEVFDYLKQRKGLIDGLVITGGEPLIQKDIIDFIKKVKKLGIKVKLDTNGTNYEVLKEIVDNNLVDYIAMDIKHDEKNYSIISGISNHRFDNIKKSISLIEKSNIDYEFRTTIVKEFHDINTIKNIIKLIDKKSKYFIQNFEDNERVLQKGLKGFNKEELKGIEKELQKIHKETLVRGI